VKYGAAPCRLRCYVGNSCKESTPHPNIRQYTDTRCQSVPACEVARRATVTYRTRATGLHPPPREMQFPLFLPRKASRDVPVARSSNKARPPYVREVKPRRCLRARILDLLPVVYVHAVQCAERSARTTATWLDTLFAVWGSLPVSALAIR